MERQGDLKSNLKSNLNTDGRTDGLTKTQLAATSQLAAVDAGARTDDSTVRVGDVLASGRLWMTDERHEVVRTGQRDEIPPHIRAAVWFRDRGKCEHCQAPTPPDQPWHLDHIVPWSAGGPDRTTNLRVLCEQHNIDRSNRIDPGERERRPATWWCANCYDRDHAWRYDGGLPIHPEHPWYGNLDKIWCRVLRGYFAHKKHHGELPDWHQREPVTDATTIAYCAHCDAPGLTDQPL